MASLLDSFLKTFAPRDYAMRQALDDDEKTRAVLSQIFGGTDPLNGITWNGGRQSPTSQFDMNTGERTMREPPRVNAAGLTDAQMQQLMTLPQVQSAMLQSSLGKLNQAPQLMNVDEGNTIGTWDSATQKFTPIYQNFKKAADELTPWQQKQIELSESRLAADRARWDAQTAKDQAAQAIRDRPKNTAYVSRITGAPVMQDPVSGGYMENDKSVDPADLVPASDFTKQVDLARSGLAAIGKADETIAKVDAQPGAFDQTKVNIARAKGAVPGIGQQWAAGTFTPQENETRAAVARDAAMIINELYGAALSAGENERAKSFTPSPDDTLEQLIPKLKAAREWAKLSMRGYIPSAIERAKRHLSTGSVSEDQYLGSK